MSLNLRFTARSHVGRVRAGNEDSGYASARLLVIADGMGGHAAGEVASAAAVRALRQLDVAAVENPRSALRSAVVAANTRIRELVQEDPDREGMGTTLTALLWRESAFTVAHVGDSRAYVLRAGELTQITHDHTFVQTLVDEGRISADEAETHPQRSLILRSVSGHGRLDIDIDDIEAQDGDRLLVCSDGLSGVVSAADLARLLGHGDIDIAADQLIDAALAAGAPDNVTCVVAEVYDTDATGVLPEDQPAGLLVGAATDEAVDGTGLGGVGDATTEQPDRHLHDPEVDEEELLRYAPRPPARFRWLRRAGVAVVILAVAVGAVYAGLAWTRTQYYVGVDGERVAIYQGLNEVVAGRALFEVHEVLPFAVDDLPTFDREQLTQTIPAASLADAEDIGSRLETRALSCARLREEAAEAEAREELEPTPTVTPSASPSILDPELTPPTLTPSATGSQAAPTPTLTATPSTTAPTSPAATRTPPVEGDFDSTVTAAECGVGSS